MILPIVPYGTPVLRQKGAPISEITPEIEQLIQDMLDTMYEARGVGLAAQQVGKALQLTVVDVTGIKDRPSSLKLKGKEVEVEKEMPFVLINPEIKPTGEPVAGPEGCLSFPEIYADIARPGEIEVVAINEKGKKVAFSCGGLLARAIQHEVDHLNGILFIDRMGKVDRDELADQIRELQAATKSGLKKKSA